jgi:hypothetical protein
MSDPCAHRCTEKLKKAYKLQQFCEVELRGLHFPFLSKNYFIIIIYFNKECNDNTRALWRERETLFSSSPMKSRSVFSRVSRRVTLNKVTELEANTQNSMANTFIHPSLEPQRLSPL